MNGTGTAFPPERWLAETEPVSKEVRDMHILAGLLILWAILLVHQIKNRAAGAITRNAGGVFVEILDIQRVRSRKEVLHKFQEDEKRGESKNSQRSLFLFDPQVGAPRIRSYAAFCAGDLPPPKPSCSFQHAYSTARRYHMYRMVFHGALARCIPFVVACGLFASTLVWFLRNISAIATSVGSSYIYPEHISENLKALSSVQKVLLPLASTVLAFYVRAKLNWFNGLISCAWRLQGKIGDLALVIGSSAAPANDRAVLAAKYRIYRYLNVAHYLLYHSLAVEYGGDSMADLEVSHLITAEERKILEDSLTKRHIVMVWMGATIRQLAQAGRIQGDVLARSMQVLRELRSEADTLAKELMRVTPISFAQLMQLMVDIMMVLTPPSLAQSLLSDREGSSVYIWPMLGTMVLAAFYQGSLRLITALEYPFGSDLDDLHPDWLLMSSERATYLFLSEKLPPQLTGALDRARTEDRHEPPGDSCTTLPGSVMVGNL